jgi:hypothetical protein
LARSASSTSSSTPRAAAWIEPKSAPNRSGAVLDCRERGAQRADQAAPDEDLEFVPGADVVRQPRREAGAPAARAGRDPWRNGVFGPRRTTVLGASLPRPMGGTIVLSTCPAGLSRVESLLVARWRALEKLPHRRRPWQ